MKMMKAIEINIFRTELWKESIAEALIQKAYNAFHISSLYSISSLTESKSETMKILKAVYTFWKHPKSEMENKLQSIAITHFKCFHIKQLWKACFSMFPLSFFVKI